jgi:hypothetical protein
MTYLSDGTCVKISCYFFHVNLQIRFRHAMYNGLNLLVHVLMIPPFN